ncbi:MAG: 16S rRNA (guanine(527)-N(7))-methyltransferase RsmG [Bacteroidales bacterium]|nr:16S rRNA (guanine(527)-N(7))-methyltransferase RsmG [Bacteroidales bacterium]
MDYPRFEEFIKESFPQVTPEQLVMFRKMEPAYREWNSKINVISRKDIDNLYDHHILHSLAIAEYLKERKPEVYQDFLSAGSGLEILDLGTGGGFPGIPLAVLFPGVSFVLCDSIKKKTLVASEIARNLGLTNVTVVNARAESLGMQFDYVVSRAVASLEDFYPWVKGRYSKSILYLKGGDVNEEISTLMAKYRMARGAVSTWRVDSWLEDTYFESKFVLEIK